MPEPESFAFVSSFVPRQCGIATFTSNLSEAIASEAPDARVDVLAMNDVPGGYDYSSRVRFEIRQNVPADYRLAAEFLNVHQFSAVSLQHEFGIFGGACGSNILMLPKRSAARW